MKRQMKRTCSALLALSMLLSLLPISVLATEGDSLTIKTSYASSTGTSYSAEVLSALTVDNTGEDGLITLNIVANLTNAGDSNTVEIVIPTGIDLYMAPGLDGSTGSIETADYNSTQGGYFNSAPTWTESGSVNDVENDSGTLTYTLNAVSAVDFNVKVKVNPAYVYTGYTAVTHELGTVAVTLTDGGTETEAGLTISTTSLPSDMKFTSLTAEEVTPSSLNVSNKSPSENDVMVGCSNTVALTAVFSKSLSMSGANYAMRANDISFKLTVPTGATVVDGTAYTIDTTQTVSDVTAGTTTYTFETAGANFTNTGDVGSITFGSFATVQFVGDLYEAGDANQITISDLSLSMDKYDVTQEPPAFVAVDFAMDEGEGTQATTVNVVAQSTDYAPNFSSSSGDTEEIQPDVSTDEVLYAVQRGYTNNDDTSLDSYTPVKFTFEATPTGGDDTGFDAYLDTVSQVIMNVPFLGETGTPRHIAQLLSLTVTYEDGTTVPLTIPDLTYTGGAIGNYDDVTTIGTDSENNVIATYTWKTGATPQITFTAPSGESFINIEAVFSGDNNTYFTTSTYGEVIGQPKNDNTGDLYSQYVFAIYQDTDSDATVGNYTWDLVKTSDAGGFHWEQPQSFALTLTGITTNKNYMYNTAEENTIIIGDTSGSSTQNLYGYHNLGSASLSNKEGTAMDAGETVTIEIVANAGGEIANDIVKEIYFPLYGSSDLSQVKSLAYTYTDGSTGYTYIASTAVENAKYTVGVSTPPETFGIVQAEDGKSLASLTVTLSAWGKDSTSGYVVIRGYVDDETTLEVDDSYTVTVTTSQVGDTEPSPVTLNNTLSAPLSTYGNVQVLDTKTYTVESGTFSGSHSSNVLSPGLSTQVEFDLMGGTIGFPYSGSWHAITFNVVLPADVALTDATAYDWRYQYGGNSTNFSVASSTETAGDITITTTPVFIDSTTAADYYGVNASEVPNGAYIYTCTFDPNVNLYGMRVPGNNGAATFTVGLDLEPTVSAGAVTVPWSKVLVLGSDASMTLSLGSTYNYGEGSVATVADAYNPGVATVADAYNPGVTSTVITGPSDKYLTVDSSAKLMLHNAYVTDSDGATYTYTASEPSSVALFDPNEAGTLHFSVTNMVPSGVKDDAVNYVLFALPTTATDTVLMEQNDFVITLNGVESITCNTGTTVTAVYATMDADDTIAFTSGADLFGSGVAYDNRTGLENTLVLKIEGQDYQEEIQVSIPFKMPNDTTVSTQYVEFQGVSIYYFAASSQTLYYSGASNSDTISSADNFIRFGYDYPSWDVDYVGVLDNHNSADGTTALTFTGDAPTASVADGGILTVPLDPETTVTGYTFDGWYTDATFTDQFETTETLTITADTKLYAKYTEQSYTVSFQYDGETTAASPAEVYWTDVIPLVTDNSKVGYDFDGWFYISGESGETKTLVPVGTVFSALGVADNITLVGSYTATHHYVHYTLNYENAIGTPEAEDFAWDAPFHFPTEPTRAGYTFDGWFTAADETGSEVAIVTDKSFGTKFGDVDNVYLYAHWTEKTYTLTFDTDDTDITGIAWTDDIPALPTPSKTGYTFDCWMYDTTEVTAGDTFSSTIGDVDDITLNAQWIENTYTLTLNYNDGGETPNATKQYKWTATLDILAPEPTRDGYTFTGWYTATSDGTEIESTDAYNSIDTAATGTAVLYAQWTPRNYAITFVYEETIGETTTINDNLANGSASVTWEDINFLLTATSDENSYKFSSWRTESGVAIPTTGTFGDTIGILLSDTTVTSINLYAHYPEKIITLNYNTPIDTNGAYSSTYTTWQSVVVGAADAISETAPKINGYSYENWYIDEAMQTTLATQASSNTVSLGNLFYNLVENNTYTIYAKYTPNNYTVTYNANGGTGSVTDTIDFSWNSSITFPTAPTRDGYTFLGWFKVNDSATNQITADTAYSATFGATDTLTQTVYAGWEAKSYKIVYDLDYDNNGVGNIPSQTLGWSDPITQQTPTDRTGYSFKGWSTDTTATNIIATSGTYSSVIGVDGTDVVVTLTAIWEAKTFTPDYDLNGATSTTEILGNATAWDALIDHPDAVPTKTGYTFAGWYTSAATTTQVGDNSVYYYTLANGDENTAITFYAGWTASDYTITFQDGTATTTDNGNWTDVVILPVLSKTGYTFAGWYDDTDTKVDITSGQTPFSIVMGDSTTYTRTLYAWWTENTPDASVVYSEEKLTGLTHYASYTITLPDSSTVTLTADQHGEIPLATDTYDWFGLELSITKDAVSTYIFDSAAQNISLVDRPEAPTSDLAETTYTGGQTFTLTQALWADGNTENDDTITIYYGIYEHDDSTLLIQDGDYNPSLTYAIEETSDLVIYAKQSIGTDGDYLKSETNSYYYEITPNIEISLEGLSDSSGIAITSTTPLITAIGDYDDVTLTTAEKEALAAASTSENLDFVRFDDTDTSDGDIVTADEYSYLTTALETLSGYSEDSAFHLHATVNGVVIMAEVTLITKIPVVITLDSMASNTTYQVLHLKHGADGYEDVEIFSTSATDEAYKLTADYTAKTLTLYVDSLSPFMVVSKTTTSYSGGSSSSSSSSSSTTSTTDDSTATLNTQDHFAYMQGRTDGTFGVDNNITRAEAIVMFSRLLTETMDQDATYTASFSDVTSDLWYANAVGYMEQYGIITGYTDGTFGGDNAITRAEFAAIVSRFSDLNPSDETLFSDVSDSHWALSYITSASAYGWISGYTDGTFRPDQCITRAEAVTIVNRVLERSCDLAFVSDNLDTVKTFPDVPDTHWAYAQITEATNGHTYTKDSDGNETWMSLTD